MWDDASYGTLRKAKDADEFVYVRQTYKDPPDIYVADASLANGKKLTDLAAANKQDQFLWSSGTILVNYSSAKGDKLQGALHLPANYEKGKTYPTIVYFYERLSQTANNYLQPSIPGTGFNASVYTSHGYAVFNPDIAYKLNDPGMSAVWCIVPAVKAAIATGVVDPKRVGIHGHSWGGYQTAFIITQTDIFAAAVAAAHRRGEGRPVAPLPVLFRRRWSDTPVRSARHVLPARQENHPRHAGRRAAALPGGGDRVKGRCPAKPCNCVSMLL
jgi:dipeptidyl aminopeptidase/acylaminoacyl peptidase